MTAIEAAWSAATRLLGTAALSGVFVSFTAMGVAAALDPAPALLEQIGQIALYSGAVGVVGMLGWFVLRGITVMFQGDGAAELDHDDWRNGGVAGLGAFGAWGHDDDYH